MMDVGRVRFERVEWLDWSVSVDEGREWILPSLGIAWICPLFVMYVKDYPPPGDWHPDDQTSALADVGPSSVLVLVTGAEITVKGSVDEVESMLAGEAGGHRGEPIRGDYIIDGPT